MAVGRALGAVFLELIVSLVSTRSAFADTSGGASFAYNSSTHGISINAKNGLTSTSDLTRVDFTLPAGSTISGTPSGGGSCTKSDAQNGFCTFSQPATPGNQLFILINSGGSKPSALDITLTFADASTTHVTATECGQISATPTTLPGAVGNSSYSQQLSGSGGTSPYTFSLQGVLPAGITLSSDGLLSGQPAATGQFSFTVLPSDINACTGLQSYSLAVAEDNSAADLSVLAVSPGVFFHSEEDETINGIFKEIEAAALLNIVAVPPHSEAGFTEIPEGWHSGEVALIEVHVHNSGPDSVSYLVQLIPSRPFTSGPSYIGYEDNAQFGQSTQSITEADPPVLESGKSHILFYEVAFPSAGDMTVTAQVSATNASDPDSSDNTGRISFTVLSSDKFSKVGYKQKGSGADLAGTLFPSARLLPEGRSADVSEFEIALTKKARKTCAWLTGSTAAFQKKVSQIHCAKPKFLKARGSVNFKYHLRKRLPRGSYTMAVRRRAGADSEREFSASLGNLFTVRVK